MAKDRPVAARALWYVAPGRAELRDEAVAVPAAGEVIVRALYGALSRGTERLVFNGRVPQGEYQRMRAPMMAGAFPFPVKYGYATVGQVEEGPPGLAGQVVFVLHPHQSAFAVAAETVVPVPDGVPSARAVLAANMETALNAVWDGAPGPADRIAVVGAGVLGLLVARLCARLPAAEVTVVDIAPEREELARALGARFATPDEAPGDCDLVFHASASAAGLATALRLAGEEASIVELSWYGAGDVAAPLGGAFHSRRLKLVSSQVGRVAPSHRARWTHARRLAAALALLDDRAFDKLITGFRVVKNGNTFSTENMWHTDDASVHMSNTVVIDGVLYGLSHQNSGQYFALDLESGQVLWKSQGRQAENAAIVKAGTTLFMLQNDAQLVVLKANRSGFSPAKKYEVAMGETWAQPVVSGNRVFVKDVSNLTLWTLN